MLRLLGLVLLAASASAKLTEQPIQLARNSAQGQNAYSPQHLSGYYETLTNTHDVNIFYFLFPSRSGSANDPLVLWMTGGPGCSSELAVFYENGPYHILPNLTLEDNPYGWDTRANMLFVDQPVGTGFSYSDDPRDDVVDEAGVAADMLQFLLEFMEAHPEHAHRPFFITGESYGGHYVPAVSYAVWLYNKAATAGNTAAAEGYKFNLKGIAIGNGLTHPAIQYGAYADYALLNGLIDEGTRDSIKRVYPVVKFLINVCNDYPWVPLLCSIAFTVAQTTQPTATILATGKNLNVYDIRKECVGPLCYDFSRLDKFLAQPYVRAELGVPDKIKFQECALDVNLAFANDFPRRFDIPDIPALLDDGIRVLIYAGEKDFICNWLGNARWLDALPWSGADGYAAAESIDVKVNGTVGGTARTYKNLTFLKVANAGHMVPWDQPEFALAMFKEFVAGPSTVSLGGSGAASLLQGPGHLSALHRARA